MNHRILTCLVPFVRAHLDLHQYGVPVATSDATMLEMYKYIAFTMIGVDVVFLVSGQGHARVCTATARARVRGMAMRMDKGMRGMLCAQVHRVHGDRG